MPDPRESDQRLSVLRRRWEDDKTSLAFLPLAEEYRRLGRLGEALSVLEAGLAANPSYRSAHVALGRCRLELGDVNGAIEAFEQVLAQDPMQLVANKLLVDAYLRADRPTAAKDRLDLYALLNERDPELPGLRHRIAAAAAAQERERAVEAVTAAPPAAAPAPVDDPLEETSPAAPPVEEPAPWEAPRSAAPAPPAPAPTGEVFALPPLPARALAGPWLAPRVPEGGEPFAGLGGARDRQRYLRGLATGGVFGAPSTAKIAASIPPVSAPAVPSPVVAVLPLAAPAPAEPAPPRPVESVPRAPAPEEPPAALALEEPVRGTEPALTATLGELYLRQGHLGEAEDIFRRILIGEPANLAALAGLEEVRNRRRTGEAASAPGGVSKRKAAALRRYLERVRRGASRHVS